MRSFVFLDPVTAPADVLDTTSTLAFADYSFGLAAHSFEIALISFFDRWQSWPGVMNDKADHALG